MTPNLTLLTNDDLAAILSAPHIGDRAKANARAELARRKRADGNRTERHGIAQEGTELHGDARTIVLPWRVLVSVNARTNPVGGRQFLTKRYRKALADARELVAQQYTADPLPGALEARFDFYPPDRRRRDASNFVKLPEDAMTGIVYADDSQVQRHNAGVVYIDKADPRVEVRVRPLADEAAA